MQKAEQYAEAAVHEEECSQISHPSSLEMNVLFEGTFTVHHSSKIKSH
jgi:hypothetical protein